MRALVVRNENSSALGEYNQHYRGLSATEFYEEFLETPVDTSQQNRSLIAAVQGLLNSTLRGKAPQLTTKPLSSMEAVQLALSLKDGDAFRATRQFLEDTEHQMIGKVIDYYRGKEGIPGLDGSEATIERKRRYLRSLMPSDQEIETQSFYRLDNSLAHLTNAITRIHRSLPLSRDQLAAMDMAEYILGAAHKYCSTISERFERDLETAHSMSSNSPNEFMSAAADLRRMGRGLDVEGLLEENRIVEEWSLNMRSVTNALHTIRDAPGWPDATRPPFLSNFMVGLYKNMSRYAGDKPISVEYIDSHTGRPFVTDPNEAGVLIAIPRKKLNGHNKSAEQYDKEVTALSNIFNIAYGVSPGITTNQEIFLPADMCEIIRDRHENLAEEPINMRRVVSRIYHDFEKPLPRLKGPSRESLRAAAEQTRVVGDGVELLLDDDGGDVEPTQGYHRAGANDVTMPQEIVAEGGVDDGLTLPHRNVDSRPAPRAASFAEAERPVAPKPNRRRRNGPASPTQPRTHAR